MLDGYETITMPENTELSMVELRASEHYGGTWEVLPDAWAVWQHPRIRFCFTWIVHKIAD